MSHIEKMGVNLLLLEIAKKQAEVTRLIKELLQ